VVATADPGADDLGVHRSGLVRGGVEELGEGREHAGVLDGTTDDLKSVGAVAEAQGIDGHPADLRLEDPYVVGVVGDVHRVDRADVADVDDVGEDRREDAYAVDMLELQCRVTDTVATVGIADLIEGGSLEHHVVSM